jgi:hypothetical protein
MECKKCGIDLTGKEYRNVAQWPFCLACFQALIAKAEEKKSERAEMPAPEPACDKRKCLVCESEIEKGGGREMLGFVFCLQCYENLVKRPDIPQRAVSDEEAGVGPWDKQAVEQVQVDFITSVRCYGCSREIPAISSKQFKEQPYCPDCYYALPEIESLKPKPFPAAVPTVRDETAEIEVASGKQEDGLRCQACQRQVRPDNLMTVEGFEICTACMTIDPDTALDIARTRHRRMLEKIRRDLDI